MRNLKKVLAVILTVAMLASFMVPAFAAVSHLDEAKKLQTIGLFAGGEADLKLDEDVTRIQGLTFAIRAAGKEEEALAMTDEEVAAELAKFKDSDTVPSWNGNGPKYVAYAIKNGITVGDGQGNFKPLDKISGRAFLVFLLKSGMGYKDVTTLTAPDVAVDAGILTPSQAVTYALAEDGIIRDDAAAILFGAATNGVNADGKTFIQSLIDAGFVTEEAAIEAGFVEALKSITVNAIGAKKLEVKFNKAVDDTKAVIEAKRGNVKPTVKSITFAENKKSAVIEFTSEMIAGDYTVTVTGVSAEPLTATVKVEANKLTTIRFLSDYAIKNGNNIKTTVVGENQYGEDVTSKLATASVSVTASNGTGATVDSKGVVTVTGTNPDYFAVDSKVVVTIVDSVNAVVATKTLTVAKAAAVASIEFGTLTTDDKDLAGKEINVDIMSTTAKVTKYYLPITVKDQYGNVLKAADLLTGFDLRSSNENIVRLASTPIEDKDGKTVIKFQAANAPATYGTVVISAVATGTGVSQFTTIEVKENAKLDVVTLSTPETELKQTKDTVLPVSIVDTYGKEVALKDVTITGSGSPTLTLNGNTTISATNGTLTSEMDYVKDVRVIKITPSATAKNVIVTVTSATGKFQSLTLPVNDKPVVSGIKGLKSDVATMLANDPALTTVLKDNVVFVDQYGDEIAAPTYKATVENNTAAYYTIDEKEDNNITTFNAANGVISATTTAGTETYVATLYDKDSSVIDSLEVTITVVDAKKITAFGIDDLNKFYTKKDVGSDYNQQIKIHGLVNGKKVVVNQNMIQYVSASNGLLGINSATGVYTPTDDVDTKGEDKTSVITVLVDNGETTITATKEVVFSNADPIAQSLVVKYEDKEVTSGTVQVPVAELNNALVNGTGKFVIEAKDQYGVKRTADKYSIVLTTKSSGLTGNIDSQGTGSGFEQGDVGKSFQLNIFVDGQYKSLKVVVG